MTLDDIDEIKNHISQIPYVKNVISLEWRDYLICGKFEIDFEELKESLEFEVEIYPQYPLKSHDTETIKFINKNLLEYNHVMENGSICIHTSHDVNLKDKLTRDFESLKNWIVKYYINKDDDLNYEHIIVSESLINDSYNSYLFTEVDYEFKKGDFGEVDLSSINAGIYKDKPIFNEIVQGFRFLSGKQYECKWSERYKNLKSNHQGFFVFIENAPANHNRFASKDWSDLIEFLPSEFLRLLHEKMKALAVANKKVITPIFIGYKTINTEIHWQVAMLNFSEAPLESTYEMSNGILLPKFYVKSHKISWALSRNTSYKYFFGRGILAQKIVDRKILILGIGAIGSILATTLVRCGCKSIDLADYDIKEPENVCRSEYIFDFGLNDKVTELSSILTSISPFVETGSFKRVVFEDLIKIFHKDKYAKELFEKALNEYDIIFDCTTDNDLMYILNSLDLSCDLINLSITNHANELVCAFYPNIYRFVINQYTNILDNDFDDLYNPTGCWSPTFKASYNDINVLVQTAIQHINLLYGGDKPKNNFVLKTTTKDLFGIKIEEY